MQLIEVLNFCHSKGFLHLDVKPSNLFVYFNPPKLYLADLGFAVSIRQSKKSPI